MATFNIKQGDLEPNLDLQLLKSDGQPQDLSTGVSGVQMRWRKPDGTVTTVSLTIVAAATGQVRYAWVAGDTSIVGVHLGEAIVTWTTGTEPQTFPVDGYFEWEVQAQLATGDGPDTFVVEDGTVVANANSYLSVAEADSYHASRGRTDWAKAEVPDKQAALIRATAYIDMRYGDRFRGVPVEANQSLEWPRDAVYDRYGTALPSDELPGRLEKATAEYALEALRLGELVNNPAQPTQGTSLSGARTGSPGGEVTAESKTVGPISISKSYATRGFTGTTSALPTYTAGDLLLAPLLRSGGGVDR